MAASDLDFVIDHASNRLRESLGQSWRCREIAEADEAATQIRPWFYENYVRHGAGGIDPGVGALLTNRPLTLLAERRASWRLIRDLSWRLRHAADYPRLSGAARHNIRVAIRTELRRLAIRSAREPLDSCSRSQAAE